MLKRFLQGVGIIIAGIFLIALWQWRRIQRKRRPALNAQDLISNPDHDVTLMRYDDTLTIRWIHPTTEADIFVGDAYQPMDRSQPIATVVNQQMAIINGIQPKKRYKVMIRTQDNILLAQTERTVPLDGAPNFRDIGGYRTTSGQTTHWNRVYRSSALDQLSDHDRKILSKLRIQWVCDVRTTEEHQADPDQLPDSIHIESIAPSSNDNVWVALMRLLFTEGYLENLMNDLYQRVMVKDNPQVFKRIFERLADPACLPMVIHCAAGKDRTGITIALLLAFLGVPDETIIADYSLSNHHYHFFKQATRKNLAQLRIIGLTEKDFDHLLVADGAVMQKTLNAIRKEYGSVEAYLLEYVGLDATTLSQIKANLLI